MFHILMIDSAVVSRIESSGDHARYEIGSAWSRRILSSAKPFYRSASAVSHDRQASSEQRDAPSHSK